MCLSLILHHCDHEDYANCGTDVHKALGVFKDSTKPLTVILYETLLGWINGLGNKWEQKSGLLENVLHTNR